MKEIKDERMFEYFSLKENEWFEYQGFKGIKIDDNYAAFINGNMQFVIGKVYLNCISIGSGTLFQFESFRELIDALANHIETISEISKL